MNPLNFYDITLPVQMWHKLCSWRAAVFLLLLPDIQQNYISQIPLQQLGPGDYVPANSV